MSLWDGILLAITAGVAVRTLVGMMRRRSDRLVEEVQKQVDAHREREKERALRARRKARNEAA